MKSIITIFLCVFSFIRAVATAQYAEIININGESYGLFNAPLSGKIPNKVLEKIFDEPCSTALWRGYIGHWSIKENRLMLDSVCRCGKERVDLSKYLGSIGPVFANWVTDTLHVIGGKTVYYKHMAWESEFETDIYLVVKNGMVISRKVFHNKKIIPEGMDLSDEEKGNRIKKFVKENCPWMDKRRMVITMKYSDFDSKGQPSKANITFIRNPYSDELSEEQMNDFVTKLEKFLLENPIFELYYIRDKYVTAEWILPISNRKEIE